MRGPLCTEQRKTIVFLLVTLFDRILLWIRLRILNVEVDLPIATPFVQLMRDEGLMIRLILLLIGGDPKEFNI